MKLKSVSLLLVFILLLSSNTVIIFAQSDSDGDGIADVRDRCPNEAGPANNGGCPLPASDRDGDTVVDTADRCPDQAGDVNNGGCPLPPAPDRDGDTVPDAGDICPDQAGDPSNSGCPHSNNPPTTTDRDGDGLSDTEDRCPDQSGPRENNGCPVTTDNPPPTTDRDGDGFPDDQDRCPDRAGSANGCPLPSLPDDGRCVLATGGGSDVNIRQEPSTQADIVGQISPFEIVPVLGATTTPEGLWYHIAKGWVFGEVIRLGGDCDESVSQTTPLTPPTTPTSICDGFVGVTPMDIIGHGPTYFEWTNLADPTLSWYELTLYDGNGQWVKGVGKGPGEPWAFMDTSVAEVGAGPNFAWKVIAYSNSETVLCETPLYPVARATLQTAVYPSTEPCANFVGLSPLDELNATTTHFEWSAVPNKLYYQLTIYDSANQAVQSAFSVNTSTNVLTTSAAIGDAGWSWDVQAFAADYSVLCVTPRYPVTRQQLTVTGAPVGEVECANFVGLNPTEGATVSDAAIPVDFSWTAAAPANVAYYVRVYNMDSGISLGKPTMGDTLASLLIDASIMGEGSNFAWDVAAYPTDNPGGEGGYETALCVTPRQNFTRAAVPVEPLSVQLPILDPTREITEEDLPRPYLAFDLGYLCNTFMMVAFNDSPTWSQFWWVQQGWADHYAINIFDENQQWLKGYDSISAGTAIYVVDLGLGAKQDFWFNVQAVSKSGYAVCSTMMHFVERDFDYQSPYGEITVIPNITLAPSICDTFVGISPTDKFQNVGQYNPLGETWFEWTDLTGEGASKYELSIYNASDQWVNGAWITAAYGSYASVATGAPYIGAGTEFSWDVKAYNLDGDLLCATPRIKVTRDSLPVSNARHHYFLLNGFIVMELPGEGSITDGTITDGTITDGTNTERPTDACSNGELLPAVYIMIPTDQFPTDQFPTDQFPTDQKLADVISTLEGLGIPFTLVDPCTMQPAQLDKAIQTLRQAGGISTEQLNGILIGLLKKHLHDALIKNGVEPAQVDEILLNFTLFDLSEKMAVDYFRQAVGDPTGLSEILQDFHFFAANGFHPDLMRDFLIGAGLDAAVVDTILADFGQSTGFGG